MKLRSISSRLIATVFSLLAINANASLIIDTDENSYIDLTTELEWIDFGQTNNMSYTYVSSQLNLGGQFEGWRLPTQTEVNQMWLNLFLPLNPRIEELLLNGEFEGMDGKQEIGSVYTELFTVIGYNLFVPTNNYDERKESTGWFINDQGEFSRVRTIEYTDNYGSNGNYDDYVQLDLTTDFGETAGGTTRAWSTLLVKDWVNPDAEEDDVISVPEPSSALLFMLSLLGLSRRFKVIINSKLTS